jgi:hypothetical protein
MPAFGSAFALPPVANDIDPEAPVRHSRRAVEKAIEGLIGLLDTLDGDPDREEDDPAGGDINDERQDADDEDAPEPSLGSGEITCRINLPSVVLGDWIDGKVTPRPQGPWIVGFDQELWAEGADSYAMDHEHDESDLEDTHDDEQTNEDGGDVQDERHDAEDEDTGIGDAGALNIIMQEEGFSDLPWRLRAANHKAAQAAVQQARRLRGKAGSASGRNGRQG